MNPLMNKSLLMWFRAFVLGYKEQGFNGTGPISESGNEMILVTYNYRVSLEAIDS